jgi:hypothetical protein
MATINDLLYLLENGWSPHQARQSLKASPYRIRQMLASRRVKDLVDLHQQMALIMSQYRACCSMVQAVRTLEEIVCARKEPGEVSRRAAGQLLRMLGLMANHDRGLLNAQDVNMKLSGILRDFSPLSDSAHRQEPIKSSHAKDLQPNRPARHKRQTNTNPAACRVSRRRGPGQERPENDARPGDPAWPPQKDASVMPPPGEIEHGHAKKSVTTPPGEEDARVISPPGEIEHGHAKGSVTMPPDDIVVEPQTDAQRLLVLLGDKQSAIEHRNSNKPSLPLKQYTRPTPAINGRVRKRYCQDAFHKRRCY